MPKVAKVLQEQMVFTHIHREWHEQGEGWLLLKRKTTWGLG